MRAQSKHQTLLTLFWLHAKWLGYDGWQRIQRANINAAESK